MSSPIPLQIDIASDVVCPWCYIGKRRLEKALVLWKQKYPESPAPQVRWLPFQLNPDLPLEGISRADYLFNKFGSADGGGRYERVRAEGDKEGLKMEFDKIKRQPNTLKAHALIGKALDIGRQEPVKEALMQAYFCQGADLTQDAVLQSLAVQAGMPAQMAEDVLHDQSLHQAIAAKDAELRSLGIQGVPFFILNQRIGVSGAQMPEQLLEAFMQAAQTVQPTTET